LIWGAIKGYGNKIFIRCPTRLDSTAYQAVLEEGLQDMYVYARSTTLYPEKKKISLLSGWSPQSPDINVIKNIWSILKTCVLQFNITSSDDLWNATLKAWNDIP